MSNFNAHVNINIIKPEQFTLVPWKNGLGHTTELAINEGGDLNGFDWRLSIASVVADGEFSNFSGYQRNLVLIEGNSLTLDHQNGEVDKLNNLLDIARFDGGCKTLGSLSHGSIKDFNIMTKIGAVTPTVNCYRELKTVTVSLSKTRLCFAYSLTDDMTLENIEGEKTLVTVGCLIQLSSIRSELENVPQTCNVTGKDMIVILLEFN